MPRVRNYTLAQRLGAALRLAKRLQIRVIPTKSEYSTFPRWTGRTMVIYRNTSYDQILHEVAHYLVASPRRRRRTNFGLGSPFGVDPDDERTRPTVAFKFSSDEEERASLLGIALEFHMFGGNSWMDTSVDQNWNLTDDYWQAISIGLELERRKLLKNGRPTVLIRKTPRRA